MKTIWVLLVASALSFGGYAQQDKGKASKSQHKTTNTTSKRTIKIPEWAAAQHYEAKEHLYFPDYYTYYDPQRGGYVYWNNGKYTFSPAVPPYLEKVDLSKSRIKLLKGLSLDLHPEQNYPNYMKLYPAEHNYDKVPVPVINPHQR